LRFLIYGHGLYIGVLRVFLGTRSSSFRRWTLIVFAVELDRDLTILTTDPSHEDVAAVFDFPEFTSEEELREALDARDGFWKCVDREDGPTIVTWHGLVWEDLPDAYLLPCDYFTFDRDDLNADE
jgi:hypothetical protein